MPRYSRSCRRMSCCTRKCAPKRRTSRRTGRRTSMSFNSRWNRMGSTKSMSTRFGGMKKTKRRTMKRKARPMSYKFSTYARANARSTRRTFSRRKAA